VLLLEREFGVARRKGRQSGGSKDEWDSDDDDDEGMEEQD